MDMTVGTGVQPEPGRGLEGLGTCVQGAGVSWTVYTLAGTHTCVTGHCPMTRQAAGRCARLPASGGLQDQEC